MAAVNWAPPFHRQNKLENIKITRAWCWTEIRMTNTRFEVSKFLNLTTFSKWTGFSSRRAMPGASSKSCTKWQAWCGCLAIDLIRVPAKWLNPISNSRSSKTVHKWDQIRTSKNNQTNPAPHVWIWQEVDGPLCCFGKALYVLMYYTVFMTLRKNG